MTDSDRLSRLSLAQSKIVARLDDPATPAYSVAPLSNQLRLVEKALDRLTAHENNDVGLPDAELFGLVTSLSYARWLGGPHVPARRKPAGDYFVRHSEIFQTWKDAGFQLSAKPAKTGDDVADRAALVEWVEDQRAELVRCLATDEERR